MKTTYESEQLQPAFMQRVSYEDDLKSWLRAYEFKYFFTLTFRSDVSIFQGRDDLNYFAERLSKSAFGSGWKTSDDPKARVSFVASFERNTSGRLHIHVAMQPLGHSYRFPDSKAVKSAVCESWKRCKANGYQLDFQLINNNDDRVVSYLFKEVKYDTDTFYADWFSAQR